MDFGRLLTFLTTLVGIAGCPSASAPEASPSTRFEIYAVNYPLAYFAERLSPNELDVAFPAPPRVDPAYWRPTPETIAEFQNADLVLLNGAGYAAWTRTSTLPRSRSVVTVEGCRDAFLPAESTTLHRHGPEGRHSHGDTAFATWLDLQLAACQAGHVRDALARARPNDSSRIRGNWGALERDLRNLDTSLRQATRALGDAPVFASHPVYAYLGDAYGLDIHSFHYEPGRPLEPEDLAALDSARKDRDAWLMLWEDEPLATTRKALEDRGIRVVVFNPSSNRPEDGDFISVMRGNVERLRCATDPKVCP